MMRPYALSIKGIPQMHMNFLFYFIVAATLKRCEFLPLYHFTSNIKDMKQRTVGMGSKNFNIYQKAYQHA